MEKIAVDAMGGDFAPLEIVLGSIQAVREFKIPVVLVGDKEQILTILKNNHEEKNISDFNSSCNRSRKS